jgi:hypothetical protein
MLLAVASAAALLSFGVSTSLANRLSVSSTNFEISWTPTFTNGSGSVSCEVIELIGTLHSRTITKTAGLLVGHVTEASVRVRERCSGGEAIIHGEGLPWHLTYSSFTGTLPNISGIHFRIIGLQVAVAQPFLLTCEYRSTTTNPAGIIANREGGGAITSVRSNETLTIPTVTGGGCESRGTLRISGTGGGATNPARFTLI